MKCFSWLKNKRRESKYSKLTDEQEFYENKTDEIKRKSEDSLFELEDGPLKIIFEYLNLCSKFNIRKTNTTFCRLFYSSIKSLEFKEFKDFNDCLIKTIALNRKFRDETRLALDYIYKNIVLSRKIDREFQNYIHSNPKIPTKIPGFSIKDYLKLEDEIENIFYATIYLGLKNAFDGLFIRFYNKISLRTCYRLIGIAYTSTYIENVQFYHTLFSTRQVLLRKKNEYSRFFLIKGRIYEREKKFENMILTGKKRNNEFIKVLETYITIDYEYINDKTPKNRFKKLVDLCC